MLTNIRQPPIATKAGPPAENAVQLRGGTTQQYCKKAKVEGKAPSIHIVENDEQAQACFREVEAEKRRLRSIDSGSTKSAANGATSQSL
jgi:hypothetical protein